MYYTNLDTSISIIHTVKAIRSNCIFYEARIEVWNVKSMRRLLFLVEITGFVWGHLTVLLEGSSKSITLQVSITAWWSHSETERKGLLSLRPNICFCNHYHAAVMGFLLTLVDCYLLLRNLKAILTWVVGANAGFYFIFLNQGQMNQ